MRVPLAIAVKDLRLLMRDPVGLFFVAGWPLAVAIFFGSLFSYSSSGGPGSMGLAVVDAANTSGSRSFVQGLADSAEVDVVRATLEEAETMVRHGKCAAYLLLKPGFGARPEQMFSGQDDAGMELGIDPGRQAQAGMLRGVLMKHYFDVLQEHFTDPDAMRDMARRARAELRAHAGTVPFADVDVLDRFLGAVEEFADSDIVGSGAPTAGWDMAAVEVRDVVREHTGPRSAYEVSFPQGIVWGLLSCAVGFSAVIAKERSDGTLARLRIAPLSRSTILVGKSLACAFATATVLVGVLAVGRVFFGLRPTSLALLAIALAANCIAFSGIMMLLSVLGRTVEANNGVAVAAMLFMGMLGGGSVPLFFMPGWLQAVSSFVPTKWSILSLEGAMWRGFSLREMLLPCGILVGVGVVGGVLGVRMFRWTNDG